MLTSRFGSGGGCFDPGVSYAVRCGPWQWRQCTSNSTRPARAFCLVDPAEQVLRPARRLQCRQRALDLVQRVRVDRGVVAQVQRQRRAEFVEQVEPCADAERLVDVACHRLRGVALPLHPVELGDVPQVRIAHRRRRRTVVVGRDVAAEHRVGDALRGVGAPVALEHRVVAVLEVGPRVGEQRADRSAELGTQLAPRGIEVEAPGRAAGEARLDHVAREAIEFPGIPVGCEHRQHEVRLELAGLHVGDRVHRLAAVDADRGALVVQLARVAQAAGEVEQLGAELRVVVLGEADRQVAWIPLRVCLLAQLRQEAVATHVGGCGKPIPAERAAPG